MKITILMEDEPYNSAYEHEHGLSIYIETKKHKILMDSGKSDKTLQNAYALDIPVKEIDTFVVSHAHYDHSDGLPAFYEVNDTGTIYMHENSQGEYYHGSRYIGINKDILSFDTIRYTTTDISIDDTLDIFMDISSDKISPKGNKSLLKKDKDILTSDDFIHEQCLVVKEDGLYVLFSGCAHHGILNILDTFYKKYDRYPDAVFSGFHMASKKEYDDEDISMIIETANFLNTLDTCFYTGHCTGRKAFTILQEYMDFIEYMHVGDQIVIEKG